MKAKAYGWNNGDNGTIRAVVVNCGLRIWVEWKLRLRWGRRFFSSPVAIW